MHQKSYFELRRQLEGESLFLTRYSAVAGANVHDIAIYGFRSTGYAYYDNNADLALTEGYLTILDIASVIERGATVLMGDDALRQAYNLLQAYFYALRDYTTFPNGALPTQEEMLRLDFMQEKLFDLVKYETNNNKFASLLCERTNGLTGAQIARQLMNPQASNLQGSGSEGPRLAMDRRVGLADLISPEVLMNAPNEDTSLQELDELTFLPPQPKKLRFE